MSKPIKYYKPESLSYVTRFHDGQVASVMVDEKWLITSEVLKKNPDGSFETLNSIYVPKDTVGQPWLRTYDGKETK